MGCVGALPLAGFRTGAAVEEDVGRSVRIEASRIKGVAALEFKGCVGTPACGASVAPPLSLDPTILFVKHVTVRTVHVCKWLLLPPQTAEFGRCAMGSEAIGSNGVGMVKDCIFQFLLHKP